jgi:hypothetical protein
VNAQRVQLFFQLALLFACSSLAGASDEKVYALKFTDVDGNQLSTADGRITVLVFATSTDISRAEVVGDRIPDFCLGNSSYRMITVVEAKTHSAPVRLAFASVARRRLDSAAKRIQVRYDSHKITRTARQDVFAVIDFGSTIAANFTNASDAFNFRVVVLGPTGGVRKEWTQLPTTEELAAALK